MPINTDLNIAPIFDDYDANNQYYRILYRAGTALQARELTQMQTMQQTQIERIGNVFYRNGDLVSNTGFTPNDDPIRPYARLQDNAANGTGYVLSDLLNTYAYDSVANLSAKVVFVKTGLESQYPNTATIYLEYKFGSGSNSTTSSIQSFSNNRTLEFRQVTQAGNTVVATINTYANTLANTYATGNGHFISVSEGIIFINGTFVRVPNPTYGIVNAYGTYAGNTVVGFTLKEEIITEVDDPSLLDNALGYPNENAPGAWRLKLTPELTALDPAVAANTPGFNVIAQYNYGSLISKSTAGKDAYQIAGDVLDTRMYESAGNYVVNPFTADTISTSPDGDFNANYFYGRIGAGIGYVQGTRVSIDRTAHVQMRRGIDTLTKTSQQITFNYGGYYSVNEVAGIFEFNKAQKVYLYDTAQKAVTNRTFAEASVTGTLIGNAMARCFTLNNGVPGTNAAIYNVHLFNIQIANGYSPGQVKALYANSTHKGFADLYKTGLQGTSAKPQLYTFGFSGIKNLRDASNNNNTEYLYRTANTSATMATDGSVSIIISSSQPGGTDILPFGIGTLNDSDAQSFNLILSANVSTVALAGTVNVYTTNTSVLGTSTAFTTRFASGDQIKVGSEIRTVASVSNNTVLNVDAPFSVANTGQTYYKTYLKGKILPISSVPATGPVSNIAISNSTAFTIYSGQANLSTSVAVDVVYDVLRTSTSPAKKAIKKDRFVKINTSANPYGPWCLGYSDVHKVSKVYASADGSYALTGLDVTGNFTFDTGQRDSYYDLAYLYAKPGYSTSSFPYLLVQLDYFQANTSTGVGFFTVESYPIDDANTSNTTAIQTKDIPLYVSDSGDKIWLRDYIDFRAPATLTANDTGAVDLANSVSVNNAISYAVVNPSSALTLQVPTNGLNVPSYGGNFQADYTMYLPRKDLVFITKDKQIKIKEGLPSVTPQTPLYPENAMPIAVYDIPSFPSLTTDQMDSEYLINKVSKTLTRDTSTNISTSLLLNRRYSMKDIAKLDDRITNLEYYTQLSLLEKKAKDMTVTDANGLDRFKNGIFADAFNSDLLTDTSNPENSICIDADSSLARPYNIREDIPIVFNSGSSTRATKTGRAITLPYTEVSFLPQPYATKYRNSAHVASAWHGKLQLFPCYDNSKDTANGGSLSITVDNTKAWKDYAKSPYGTIWGDWRTSTSTSSNTVFTSGSQQKTVSVDIGYVGGNISEDEAYRRAVQKLGGNSDDYVKGTVTGTFTG